MMMIIVNMKMSRIVMLKQINQTLLIYQEKTHLVMNNDIISPTFKINTK